MGHERARADHGGRQDRPAAGDPAWLVPRRDAWLIVASFGGNAKNPAWYHNLAAHPDQAEIEVGGRKLKVTATQLTGADRDAAWQRIIAAQPRYAGYQTKTDREIPILRLTASPRPAS